MNEVYSYDGEQLSLPAAICDSCILESFTGSKVSEYAQFKLNRGIEFNLVPANTSSSGEVSKLLAFIMTNFNFYSADRLEVAHTQVH